ncbi:MAG: hypothetical protein HZA91_10295 [Verrucomicrobia bacterium]|nr:hypothetical protein [Verrucomicrobiota bacterium]
MKRFSVLTSLLVFCGAAWPASAQSSLASPVQVTVQPLNTKKGSGGYYSQNVVAGRALRITIQNLTPQQINGLTLRWAVVKSHMGSGSDAYRERAFGAEQQVDLKSLETKVIETDAVGASRYEWYDGGYKHGDVINGHGAQVLRDGKIIAEQLNPPTLKKAFEEIRPIKDEKK